jgi:hypothetical protein
MELSSTERLDELFKKGLEEGLNDKEVTEFLFLMEAQGIIIPKRKVTDEKVNVH